MERSFARRRLLTGAAALGAAAVIAPAPAYAAPPVRRAWPTSFPLPNGWRPEGITIGRAPYAYLGSIATGDVRKVSLATGRGRTVVKGRGSDAHPVIGLKIDERYDRLYLCGGWSREIRIADLRSGLTSRTWTVGAPNTMVNDAVVTPGAVWFTDSYQPQLYRLPVGRGGALGEPATVPLTGDWEQGPGFTANGIERTPDGRALLVANNVLAGGSVVRVDPGTGRTRRVALDGPELPYADGLLLLGRTLYVVQQSLNLVDVFRLDEAGTRGRALARFTDPGFRIPTTAAAHGDRVYLPNARFDVAEPGPDTAYDVVSIRRV
ncbi:SMP-30/gluconolactonase/LRE family protein [Streptomyces sp. NPDC060194]|uniref:SMP-30/gluconolactonase/LRE family protein n=1 Tax=Streptomyces sp. NPDC060194 TaxID=3347069 RepID=UPI00365702AB